MLLTLMDSLSWRYVGAESLYQLQTCPRLSARSLRFSISRSA
jgi:hypothetical protein